MDYVPTRLLLNMTLGFAKGISFSKPREPIGPRVLDTSAFRLNTCDRVIAIHCTPLMLKKFLVTGPRGQLGL